MRKIFFYSEVTSILVFIIYLISIGIWEHQVLKPMGMLISTTPKYFWLESVLFGLGGLIVILGFCFLISFVRKDDL